MKPILYLGCPSLERADVERVLAAADLAVVWADNAAHANSELQRRDMPVLIDLTDGAAALQSVRELSAGRTDAVIFAVVDALHPELTTEAVLAGVADVFARPLGGRRVANAIARERTSTSGSRSVQHAAPSEDLYCHSPAMRDVSALVARAATMRAGVIVRGEDGTGRQVVARAIHVAQAVPNAEFVVVDCAAHEAAELETILFGPQGTDSIGRGFERVTRSGQLLAAHAGTLYLQNVVDAPSRVQSRLARILRDREAHLVDGDRLIPLDVRAMASIEGSIEVAVEEGRIREDLYRRLSAIRIDLPPLRARREDIPALANYFVRQICADRHVEPKTLSRPALSLVSALPWRGNAAEMRVLLESAIAGLDGSRSIAVEDVLAHVRLDSGVVAFAGGGTLRQARQRFEREYIVAVLEHHHGRISEAAKALGIQRTNLYRKLRSLHVVRQRR